MLKFLKNIFNKKEVSDDVSLTIAEISQVLDEQLEKREQDLLESSIKLRNNLHTHKEKILANIDVLKKAELHNKKVPERAVHFMEGNRDSYSRKITYFLEKLDIPESRENLPMFVMEFEAKLNDLAQDTSRAYKILTEFFSYEVRAISQEIRAMDQTVAELRSLLEMDYGKKIELAKNLLSSLEEEVERKSNVEKDVTSKEEVLDDLRNQKLSLERERESGLANNEYTKIKDRKQELVNVIKQQRDSLIQSFSTLETGLKKYERETIKNKELVKKYLESPIDALSGDLALEITTVLKELKEGIEKGTIDVKDKKAEKTIAEVNSLDKEYFSNWLRTYGHNMKEEAELSKKLAGLDVVKRLFEIKEGLPKIEQKIQLAQKDFEKASLEAGRDKVSEIKTQLENTMSDVMGKHVTIN